jgi:hypothetical protein
MIIAIYLFVLFCLAAAVGVLLNKLIRSFFGD